mmetsp:Transcript_33676/g.86343  ORF Transcript_33676/g.86343 Transcript_33676/m.86343 type:complete len:81 (+) Transcript_33676:226-468(+)
MPSCVLFRCMNNLEGKGVGVRGGAYHRPFFLVLLDMEDHDHHQMLSVFCQKETSSRLNINTAVSLLEGLFSGCTSMSLLQ